MTLFFFSLHTSAQNNFPEEVNLVFDYIVNKDYPEVFNGQNYKLRPVRWAICDIDDDKVVEVFLQTFPHYTQSPTVTVYQIHPDNSVSRITEAFAPGPLVKWSEKEDYLTPHATRTAIDSQLDSNEKSKLETLAKSSLKFGMSVVLYKNFNHMDKREGDPFYLDLTYTSGYEDESSCEKFQFSFPDNLAAGKINSENHKFLVAQVQNELYCYRIKAILENGWIDDDVIIINLPEDFKELKVKDDQVKYLDKNGKLVDLKL